ncbi:hypothetical protein DL93DRAFT_2101734 [Clavulina sp. PMI_390]|nr:hypothetical protein DL93DRAFT_2101734 [Clavulina sp. PMI_390]
MDPMWNPFAFPPHVPIELPLTSLCDTIDNNFTMHDSRVVSITGYRESENPTTHRFIVLQLRSDETPTRDIWLRLDRRRGAGVSRLELLLFQSSVSKANDLENCWFFCSLIEQHLVGTALSPGSNSEWFVDAGIDIKHINLGGDMRYQIFSQYWADHAAPQLPARERLTFWEQSWNPPLTISSSGASKRKVVCMAGPFDVSSIERIRGITIYTHSSHQGKVRKPERGTSSWFELAVCRPAFPATPQESLTERVVLSLTTHNHPIDSGNGLQEYISMLDESDLLQVASALWDFPGAKLIVFGYAEFDGWKNVVERASISLELAELST